jgi:5'(3')-deoxyribonucleotidase/uncharacterized protein with PQ loop repeat
MSAESWVVVVGAAAACCTTLAFVPQAVKTWRQGGRDLSYGTLFLFLAGVLLWLVYGLLIRSWPVILANVATALLVSTNLAIKWIFESRPRAAPARRLRIAIDMDEVLADTLAKQLRLYEERFGTRLAPEALQGRELEEAVPAEHAAALGEAVLDPSFFRDLAPIEGSQEVVRDLASRYEVFVVSAAMEVPTSLAAKYGWLREHFPFIPNSHIVFCGDKAAVDADYMIDDSPRHFDRFRGTPLLFDAPHNRGEGRFLRVSGWHEVRRLLLGDPRARPSLDGSAVRLAPREGAASTPE